MAFREPQPISEKITNGIALVWPVSVSAPVSPVTIGLVRQPRSATDWLYHHKRSGLAGDLEAVEKLKQSGYTEGLFISDEGNICETLYANILAIKDGSIITPGPETPCLPGITGLTVERAASSLGLSFKRQAISLKELATMDEIWLSSSIQGIRVVNSIPELGFNSHPTASSLLPCLLQAINAANAGASTL